MNQPFHGILDPIAQARADEEKAAVFDDLVRRSAMRIEEEKLRKELLRLKAEQAEKEREQSKFTYYGPPTLAPNEAPPANPKFRVAGKFFCRLINKDGSIADQWAVDNGAATVGLNYLLDAGFRAQSQLGSWYIGLINNSGYTAVSAADTMSSHSGWTEFTGYSDGTRRQWSPGAASGGVLINSSAASFTINSTGTVRGMFLASDSTKSGTSGTLWATAVESSGRDVTSGQTFQVYYQLTLTPVS